MVDRFDSTLSADEEQAIASFMRRLALQPTQDTARMAAADVLWWKAELLRRWHAERSVSAPLDVAEPLQIAAGLAAVAALVIWALPSVMRAFAFIHM